jgi:hypothetical protein
MSFLKRKHTFVVARGSQQGQKYGTSLALPALSQCIQQGAQSDYLHDIHAVCIKIVLSLLSTQQDLHKGKPKIKFCQMLMTERQRHSGSVAHPAS